MRTKTEILADLEQKAQAAQALYAKGDGATADDLAAVQTYEAEITTLQGELDARVQFDDAAARSAQRVAQMAAVKPITMDVTGGVSPTRETGGSVAPVQFARTSSLRHFQGGNAEERAYRFGRFCAAALFGHKTSRQFCDKNGIQLFAASETTNSAGGFLVPNEFGNDIIDLREQFGAFRKVTKVEPMASETKSVPRRTGGLTVYQPGENTGITTSDKTWDQVTLVAKKWAVLSYYSTELSEDAIVNLGDDLAGEISYAFAAKEDDCAFNGDGTSTYFGIKGFCPAFKALDTTIANIAGLKVATTGSKTAWTSVAAADMTGVVALLPEFADTPRTAWVCSKSFWANVMERLILAAGGVTAADMANGGQRKFLGYPVIISQKMPKTTAASQVSCLLGDFTQASKLGDRREVTIATSEHVGFANDQLAIRGTERIDIVVHDVGNASSTAADRQPGPVVGLIMDA